MSRKLTVGGMAGLATCLAASALFSAAANANLVIPPNPGGGFNPSYKFDGNDCAGEAGDNFKECSINGSPIIAKFNTPDEKNGKPASWEYNNGPGKWTSITGDEFTAIWNGTHWNWTYTPTAPDPLITWVVAKQGNEFTAFYLPGATSGSWLGDLSHFSFYDTVNPIPLPAAAWLLGSGLLGLFGLSRRRKSDQVVAA